MFEDSRKVEIVEGEPIGWLRLKNYGGFVAKLSFLRLGEEKKAEGSGDSISLGQTEIQDPGDFGIPNGTTVTVRADVVAGKGKNGAVWFRYDKGNPNTARFAVCGTTLNNEVGFTGYETKKKGGAEHIQDTEDEV